jgi:hypothetical protein
MSEKERETERERAREWTTKKRFETGTISGA